MRASNSLTYSTKQLCSLFLVGALTMEIARQFGVGVVACVALHLSSYYVLKTWHETVTCVVACVVFVGFACIGGLAASHNWVACSLVYFIAEIPVGLASFFCLAVSTIPGISRFADATWLVFEVRSPFVVRPLAVAWFWSGMIVVSVAACLSKREHGKGVKHGKVVRNR